MLSLCVYDYHYDSQIGEANADEQIIKLFSSLMAWGKNSAFSNIWG